MSARAAISNVIAFDDGPSGGTDVPLVGAVWSGDRLDGVLIGRVRRDGANATRVMAERIERSQFRGHVRAVLLQGIAVAGFNVVDVHALSARLGLPVVVVVRRRPRLEAIRRALIGRVRGGSRKWRLVERAGPVEPLGPVFVQRVGLDRAAVERMFARLTIHGALPEPIRVAHLIAGALVGGVSRGRA